MASLRLWMRTVRPVALPAIFCVACGVPHPDDFSDAAVPSEPAEGQSEDPIVSDAPVLEPTMEEEQARSFRFLQTLAVEAPAPSARAFGRSLALSPSLSVIGSPSELTTQDASVLGYALREGRWEHAFELAAPQGGGSGFGATVALGDDDLIVVGAPLADLDGSDDPSLDSAPDSSVVSRAGAVYVFAREEQGFVLSEVLRAPQSQAWQNFGGSLALDHDRLVVGASDRDQGDIVDAGAAFVFERVDGHFAYHSELTVPDPQPGDRFGSALSLLGDTLVAGAPLRDHGAVSDAGAAYVFARHDGRYAFQALLSGAPEERGLFGVSVSLSYTSGLAQRLLVGVPGHTVEGIARAGVVRVFESPGFPAFVERPGLASNAPSADAAFGSTLGQERGWAVVGSGGDCARHPPEVFAASSEGLTHHSLLAPPDVEAGTALSANVALAGGHLLWGTENMLGSGELGEGLASTVHAFEITD